MHLHLSVRQLLTSPLCAAHTASVPVAFNSTSRQILFVNIHRRILSFTKLKERISVITQPAMFPWSGLKEGFVRIYVLPLTIAFRIFDFGRLIPSRYKKSTKFSKTVSLLSDKVLSSNVFSMP